MSIFSKLTMAISVCFVNMTCKQKSQLFRIFERIFYLQIVQKPNLFQRVSCSCPCKPYPHRSTSIHPNGLWDSWKHNHLEKNFKMAVKMSLTKKWFKGLKMARRTTAQIYLAIQKLLEVKVVEGMESVDAWLNYEKFGLFVERVHFGCQKCTSSSSCECATQFWG